MKYREADRNQLANCMLLTACGERRGRQRRYAAGRVVRRRPAKDAYLDMHLIPKDPALWKLERFEDFIEARKKLIRNKFDSLLVAHNPASTSAS